jgi:hypothetical protein
MVSWYLSGNSKYEIDYDGLSEVITARKGGDSNDTGRKIKNHDPACTL